MFFLCLLGLHVPCLALAVGEVLPGHADDLGERAVVGFDLGGDVLTLDKRRAEEDKGVGRARYISRAFPASGLGVVIDRRLIFGGEDISGSGLKGRRSIIGESGGSNVWRELDCLQGRLYGRGPLEIEL